jgi:hypothetical protein
MEVINTIEKIEFQVQIQNEEIFPTLSEEIAHIVENSLEKFIDLVFLQLGIAHHQIVIPKLEIDLGYIRPDRIKDDLIEKFQFHFAKIIQQIIKSPQVSVMNDLEKSFFVIDYFLSHGTRPWWLVKNENKMDDFYAKAIEESPNKFSRLVNKHFLNHKGRKRIENSFSEINLRKALVKKLNVDLSFFEVLKTFVSQTFLGKSHYQKSEKYKEILRYLYFNKSGKESSLLTVGEIVQHFEWTRSSTHLLTFKKVISSSSNTSSYFRNLFDLDFSLLHNLQFFLLNGFLKPESGISSYKFRNINLLFPYLLQTQPQLVIDLLLEIGRKPSVKRRFLDNLSQQNISNFFNSAAPMKRQFNEWVVDVFQTVQEEYQPINQTFSQVKRSINEIVYELFLNKKLQTISDENYLRLLFKQTASKYGIKYNDLLFLTIKALSKELRNKRLMKFYQTLYRLYSHDFLRKQPALSKQWAFKNPADPESQLQMITKTTNEEVVKELRGFFISWIQEKKVSSEIQRQVAEWLDINLHPQAPINGANLLQLIENFSSRFGISPVGAILKVLIAQSSQPLVKITPSIFQTIVKKYGLMESVTLENSSPEFFINTLHLYKKQLSKAYILQVLFNLNVKKNIKSVDFQKVAQLIHSKSVQWLPTFLKWLDQLLIKNPQHKKEEVLFWFYHQLLVTPSSTLSLAFVQAQTLIYFNNLDARDITVGMNRNFKNQTGDFKKSNSKNNDQTISRFFDLLDRDEVLKVISSVRNLEDHYLFQLLISKHGDQFFEILKAHQFNQEMIYYVLVSSPQWLKKDLLKFLTVKTGFDFQKMILTIEKKLAIVDWIDLRNESLNYFIASEIWPYIFDAKTYHPQEILIFILQKAIQNGQVTQKFLRQISNPTSSTVSVLDQDVSEVVELLGDGVKEYVEVRNPYKVSEESFLVLLEEILENRQFPQWHPFYGYSVRDFRPYLNKLLRNHPIVMEKIISHGLPRNRFFYVLQIFDLDRKLSFYKSWLKTLGKPEIYQLSSFLFGFFGLKDKKIKEQVIDEGLLELYFAPTSEIVKSQVFLVWMNIMVKHGVIAQEQILIHINWEGFLKKLNINVQEEIAFYNAIEKLVFTFSESQILKNIISPQLISNRAIKSPTLGDVSIAKYLLMPSLANSSDFQQLILKLEQFAEVPKEHIQLLKDWMVFKEEQRGFFILQKVFQIYLHKKLWKLHPVSLVQSTLFFEVVKGLIHQVSIFQKFIEVIIQSNGHLKEIPLKAVGRFQKEVINVLFQQLPSTAHDEVLLTLQGFFLNISKEDILKNNLLLISERENLNIPSILRGNASIELLFYSHNTSVNAYEQFFTKLTKSELVPDSHRHLLLEWVGFAKKYQQKRFLQQIAQVYIFKNLWKVADKIQVQIILIRELIDAFADNINDFKQLKNQINEYSFAESVYLNQELGKIQADIFDEDENALLLKKDSINDVNTDVEEQLSHFLVVGKKGWESVYGSQKIKKWVLGQIKISPLENLLKFEIGLSVYQELVRIKSEFEIKQYFLLMRDSNLKAIKAPDWIKKLIELIFESITFKNLTDFLKIFHLSFYRSAEQFDLKVEKFIARLIQHNSFEKIFYGLKDQDPEGFSLFIANYPSINLYVEHQKFSSNLNRTEAFNRFLKYGILPVTHEISIEEFARSLQTVQGKQRDQLKKLLHRLIQSRQGREVIKKLLGFIKEDWLFDLIHPQLSQSLQEFEKLMKINFGVEVFSLFRSKHPHDKMLLVMSFWASRRSEVLQPVEIIIGLFEGVLDQLDKEKIKNVFLLSGQKNKLLMMIKNSSAKLKALLDKISVDKEEKTKKTNEVQEEIDYTEGISVYNSGLVFLWPFLGRFFTSLGLVNKEGMVGESSTERSIQLLQYIVTKNNEFEDWDLTLNKILCGVDPDFPVSTSFEPTPEEEELCTMLVNAAIFNWEKLRGTNPDTFRESFIQREGRLYKRENRWELKVEKKAYDVLLTTLPWSISMINLSWMNTRLIVEWT